MRCRLGIVSSHPIQYNAPAFAALAADARLDVKVFYGWDGPVATVDEEFGRPVSWDIPLLEGYDYTFVENVSSEPGTHHFGGLDNPRMVDEIRRWKPDVLLVYGWSFRTHLQVLRAFAKKVPVLFRGDSTLLGQRSLPRELVRRTFLRWVYRHIDVALYAGSHNRAYYLKMGLSDSQLVWSPHAVDNNRFMHGDTAASVLANQWRKKLGIEPGEFVFLFVGKLVPRKDPLTLVRAFDGLMDVSPHSSAHLVFVGEGKLQDQLGAATRPFSMRTHFLGFQNQTQMPVVYRMGNALVLPSLVETWGLVVNEVMACGRPVIVSDLVGCAPDLVVGRNTGDVFVNKDATHLRATMAAYVSDRDLANRKGMLGRELIQRWSIDAYTRRVSETALSVVGRHHKRSDAQPWNVR